MDPTRRPVARSSPAPATLKALIRLLISATLLIGSGCAKEDWIDRTLVTEDLTGTWYGRTGGAALGNPGEYRLELKQEGATVTAFISELGGSGTTGKISGPINGSVTGDLFRFKSTRGTVTGELTVNGDEMTGTWSTNTTRTIILRRADPSSSR